MIEILSEYLLNKLRALISELSVDKAALRRVRYYLCREKVVQGCVELNVCLHVDSPLSDGCSM